MSNQSHDAKPPKPNGDHISSVGCQPPVRGRFKPGQSGNPKGRPKGQRNVRTVLNDALNQRIKIREGDRSRSVTKLDAVIMTMVNAALKGDAKALASLITMMRSVGMIAEVPEVADAQPFTADDDAVLADFLRRQTPGSQQTEAKNGNEQSAPIETTPPSKEAKP